MKFYDKAVITVQSGKGGDGIVSARRETGIPYGGPAGGNGGRGGSVILRANPHMNTLVDYHAKKNFVAPNGEPGKTKEQYGKNAEDLIIHLPLGSIVRDIETGVPLRQCLQESDELVICRGGQGGIGNMHFKNAVNQYPQFSLLGEPGEKRAIEIELQLLADIALIGTPSVGKSSLINAIANVKAKVADYPFTTLIPNLGSIKHHDVSFNMIDVPGLIQGAAQGKGLGNEFLRHIRKARVLCFMLDMGRYESGMDDFAVLFDELLEYLETTLAETKDFGDIENIHFVVKGTEIGSPVLYVMADTDQGEICIMEKHIVLVLNKSDLLQDQDIIDEYKKTLLENIVAYYKKTFDVAFTADDLVLYTLSTYTNEGVTQWLDSMVRFYILPVQQVETSQQATDGSYSPVFTEEASTDKRAPLSVVESTEVDLPFLLENEYVTEQDARYAKVRTVDEAELSRLTYMLPWGNDEAEMRFRGVLDKKRFLQKMLTAGLVKGDILRVKSYYAGVEDRFVRY